MPRCSRSTTRRSTTSRCRRAWRFISSRQHREEAVHLLFLLRRHVLEVSPAVDDLPELLRLDPGEMVARRLQALPVLALHVLGDLLRAVCRADRQVVAGELDLSL